MGRWLCSRPPCVRRRRRSLQAGGGDRGGHLRNPADAGHAAGLYAGYEAGL
ncbi:MAG: hypothetical protein R3F60_16445 [bacterium]